MTNLFWSLIIIWGVLTLIRFYDTMSYVKEKRQSTDTSFIQSHYTIMQPILSGDPRLAKDLTANLENTKEMSFLWLIDQKDIIAQNVVKSILKNKQYKNRTTCLFLEEVPEGINPKSFKLMRGLPYIKTEFTIILDDDSVIDFARFKEMSLYKQSKDEFLVTGIPYNDGQIGFWSNLVAGFVNSNALLSYFPMAKVGQTNTINGMFYIAKTQLFRKYNVFDEIKNQLCDDLALADYLLKKNVQLIQSTIPCNARTTVGESKQYFCLMKRWLLFATIYLKRHFSFNLLYLVGLPTILPTLMLIIGFFIGSYSVLLVLCLIGIKAAILQKYRKQVFTLQEKRMNILYEVLNDFLLPLLYFYTILTPAVIVWRNKKIRVSDGEIHYE